MNRLYPAFLSDPENPSALADVMMDEPVTGILGLSISAATAKPKPKPKPTLQPGDFEWTPRRVNRLTRLWAGGTSATLISKRLGCTRNAVIGKAHRMKLPGRAAGRRTVNYMKPGAPKQKGTDRRRRRIGELAVMDPMPLPAPAPRAPKQSGPVPFMKLGPKHCRYPLWDTDSDAEKLCCGLPIWKEGSSYCEEHDSLCHAGSRWYSLGAVDANAAPS